MDKKTFWLAVLLILVLTPLVMAAYTAYRHPAIYIGDAKDTDLAGTTLGNGSVRNLTCVDGCTGFNATTGAYGNASYPLYIGNATGVLPNTSIPLSALNKSGGSMTGDLNVNLLKIIGTGNSAEITTVSATIMYLYTSTALLAINLAGGGNRVSINSDNILLPNQVASAPSHARGGLWFDTTKNKTGVGGATAWEYLLTNESIFAATSNVTITKNANGSVNIDAVGVKGDTGDTGATGAAGSDFAINVYGEANITGNASLVAGGGVTLTQSAKNITIAATGTGYSFQNTTMKAADTVYQNTNTTARLVVISIDSGASAGSIITVYNENVNPPTTILCESNNGVSTTHNCMTVVLPNNYYKIILTGVSASVKYWNEWN